MRFVETSLYGVYLAPVAPMMVGAWLVTVALGRLADYSGALQHVWHPALFVFALYIIVLSLWILIAARGGL